MPAIPSQTIGLAVGSGTARRSIAVRVRDGSGPPVVWLCGFGSDMGGTKALAIDSWAEATETKLVRFDYSGHGESDGRFDEATISTWLEDAQAVIAAYAADRPVLVGSSMGGWIAALVAREMQRRGEDAPTALVLIAPAFDFTQSLMWERFPPEVRAALERDGVWNRPEGDGPEAAPVTLALIEDGRRHLLLDGSFDPRCPVHILQGMEDTAVPYGHALRILDVLPRAGAVLTLIADGDHRLSRPADIARLVAAVAAAVSAG